MEPASYRRRLLTRLARVLLAQFSILTLICTQEKHRIVWWIRCPIEDKSLDLEVCQTLLRNLICFN